MDVQSLSAIGGLLSLGITLLAAIVGGIYIAKSGVSQKASEAQQSAIDAMQAELSTLRGKVEDITKDKYRLEQTIETICSALRMRGLVITIQGEMVNIADNNGSTTTTRIHP